MNLNGFPLKGKKALVTGGNTGIGLGLAMGLARAGATVAIVGRSAAKNRAALKLLPSHSLAFKADLSRSSGIPILYRAISKALGGVDILVNNAAIQCRGRADTIALKDFEAIHDINVTAPFFLAQCFAKERMARKLPGALLFTASLMSEAARPGTAAYTSTKGAIRQMIKALAVDWAPFNIRVNGIGPGYIKTEMTRSLYSNPEFDAWVKKRTPLGRWGEPNDLAGAAVFLCSDAARFITGQILYVDGGWLAAF